MGISWGGAKQLKYKVWFTQVKHRIQSPSVICNVVEDKLKISILIIIITDLKLLLCKLVQLLTQNYKYSTLCDKRKEVKYIVRNLLKIPFSFYFIGMFHIILLV